MRGFNQGRVAMDDLIDTVDPDVFCTKNIIIIIFRPTSTKPQAEILKLNNANGCNDISFGDHSILEGDRIPPLKSHGQALEDELCRSAITPAYYYYYYYYRHHHY